MRGQALDTSLQEGDGSIDRAWTWEDFVDEGGLQPLMVETAPGSPDKWVITYYDSLHRWHLEETDLKDDGSVHSLRTAAYFGDSHQLSSWLRTATLTEWSIR